VKGSDSVALCAPLASTAGANCNAMEHLPFAANDVVEQESPVIVNDAGFGPLTIAVPSVTGIGFGFEIAMVPGFPD